MNSIIIANKNKITDSNNNLILDLTSQSINYTDRDVAILDSFYVSDDMEMRADLISYLLYGSTDYYDIILKFNNISNPYSLVEGDYIFGPELDYIASQLTKPTSEQAKKDIIKQYIDASKKITPDKDRLEYLNKINNLTKNSPTNRISKYNLTPNLAEPGSTEAKLVNGEISLGESE